MKDTISTKDPSQMRGLVKYLGKRVVTKSGQYIGRVDDVLMSRYTVQGILVRNLFIDKEFISSDSDNIMLSIDPVTFLIGKRVYDADAKKLGTVTGLVRAGANDFSAILVKKHLYSRARKITKDQISTTKTNIMLNKKY